MWDMCVCVIHTHTHTHTHTRTYIKHEWIKNMWYIYKYVVHLLSHVQLSATPWTAACQASLSFTISWNSLKLLSIESVMPSNQLILCLPLLLLPSVFPSIRVFSNELALCIMWPKYWSFSFSIGPSSEFSGYSCSLGFNDNYCGWWLQSWN